ncbi:MAG: filamentous hemagglutinin N-terminal domain-containing protein, partial [Methylococcaceae bacterium]|nr:filamentous hemagglutinin N-terminal domain-containing protein [Methylococcaceae bacterium]
MTQPSQHTPHPDRINGPHRLTPLAEAVRSAILCGMAMGGEAWAAVPLPSDLLPVPSASGFITSGNVVLDHPVKGLTINQLSAKAVLDWQSFNIAKGYQVEFKQPSSTAIALNTIHQGDPSRILGSLKANGQVYLYNQNGFLFGKDSTVDTNTLVATTLDLSKDAKDAGLSRAINNKGNPAFIKDPALTGQSAAYYTDAQGKPQKREIDIEAGAKLSTQDGGRIMIVAPSIVNQGDIETPGGQAILAAATDKVYLQEAAADVPTDASQAIDKTQPNNYVRGLLVEVSTGGDVRNVGKIAANRGNVTLAGFAVNQEGVVSATTSVRLNGSVRLIARDGGPFIKGTGTTSAWALQPTGTQRADGTSASVVLGKNSVTEVSLETQSTETALDEQTQDNSQIQIMAKQVKIGESALVSAPAGNITVQATTSPVNPSDPKQINTGVSIDVQAGAKIDVGGMKNVAVSVGKNIVEVEPRSYELRDAPLQKNGPLYGKKIYVDIRNGAPRIVDISGAVARIQRSVAERSLKGGKVALSSSGDVNVSQGSTIDVSGGSIQYQGGTVKTTWLGSQGNYYEISKADPNRHYDSIQDPVKSSRYEAGYVQGADGGEMDIKANRLQLDGQLMGQTIDGLHQRESSQRAKGSTLDIDLAFSQASNQSVAILNASQDVGSQLKLLFANALPSNPLVIMDRYLERSGIRNTAIVSNRAIGVGKSADLHLQLQQALTLLAGEIEMAGRISAPSGKVVLNTQQRSDPRVGPDFNASGNIQLAKGSLIDVSGQWTNDFGQMMGAGTTPKPVALDGGSVTANASGNLTLAKGAEIAADGGAWLNGNGKLADGQGGSIDLASIHDFGRNPGLGDSNLSLEGNLHAYALNQGGKLSLTDNQILLGDASANTSRGSADKFLPLRLSTDFFNMGGFRDYTLVSNLDGITLGKNTEIRLQSKNWLLDANFRNVPSGTDIAAFSTLGMLDAALRLPTHLSLQLIQPVGLINTSNGIDLQAGSKILADIGANIALKSDGKILVGGTISAPAGAIRAEVVVPKDPDIYFNPSQGIFLDSGASLQTPGAVQKNPNGIAGIRDDSVLAGGSISLTANRGYVDLRQGSLLDVSGASAMVDEVRPNANKPGYQLVPTLHASQSGSIALAAGEGIIANGDLRGNSHGPEAEGGSLSLSLIKSLRSDPSQSVPLKTFPTGPRIIEVSEDRQPGLLDDWGFGNQAVPLTLNGLAFISANQIKAGGFDSVSLEAREDNASGYYQNQPEVRFMGSVNLATGSQIVLDTPTISIQPIAHQTAPSVTLKSTYLSLGSSTIRENLPQLPGGAARLTAQGRNIELVGGLTLAGIGDTVLQSQNDIRLRGDYLISSGVDFRNYTGTLLTSGNLQLQAAQIYPSTLSQYAIKLSGDSNGTLSIQGSGSTAPVLSAGGKLDLQAPNIIDTGVIKAPFGTIDLTAAQNLTLGKGAIVSVSAENQLIPFGKTQGGLDWLYPLSAQSNLLYGLGDKQVSPPSGTIHLAGSKIDVQTGAEVNLSGGGDLYAHELVPVSGGSVDLLDPQDPKASGSLSFQTKYAILPWLKEGLAPWDPFESSKYNDNSKAYYLGVGDSVYLADSAAGLPAGQYTLLPASYALLPGAYLITPDAQISNPQAGVISKAVDGTPIVAGYRTQAGTGFKDYQWQAYDVQSRKDFLDRYGYEASKSKAYIESTADDFFSRQATKLGTTVPSLPRDAGNLILEANTQLNLNGTVLAEAAKGGHGGQLDIAANKLRVVQQPDNQPSDGSVVLQAQQLEPLKVESMLLGGTREDRQKDRRIRVKSDTVTIGQGVQLTGPEIILAAKSEIDVGAGAHLQGQGELHSQVSRFLLADSALKNSDGALLRVSSGTQVDVVRDQAVSGTSGKLNIAQGAVLSASGSTLLDASSDAAFLGTIDMKSGSLSFTANRINLGQAPAATPGLTLTESQLQGFTVDDLLLRSASVLGLYGQFSLHANKTLDIRSPGMAVFDDRGTVDLSASEVDLSNPAGGQAQALAASGGTLQIKADQTFKLAGGAFAVNGVDAVNIQAGNRVVAAGNGGLQVTGDLAFDSPLLVAGSGADVRFDAKGHDFALNSSQPSATSPQDAGLGGKITVSARNIALNSRIALPSGFFTASADQALKLG